MHKRRQCLLAAGLVALCCSAPSSAWFVLPYLVFDAQRFAQQALAIRNEVQWIESLARHLENDVRMLRQLDYSNLGGWTTGLQRVESAVARIEALSNEPNRMGQHIEQNWPIDWSGDAAEHSRYASARDAWLARGRATLIDCRAVQNGIVAEMSAVKSRVGDLVEHSNAAGGTTAVLQARTQLNGELSGELSKLQALRLSRAILRSERIAREQSEMARAAAVRDWLMRRDGTRPPAEGRGAYPVIPIPEQPMAHGGAR
jgi:P-type conjugative transfer protein TrbJ